MLSILIPTYNYDVSSLVTSLENQCTTADIIYEIIVLEDGSTKSINTTKSANTKIIHLKQNQGRVGARQKLAEEAKYDWLLFLDADVMPKSSDFITNYLELIAKNKNCITGGIAYQKEKPNKNYILRWKYGKIKEEIPASKRNKNPYKSISFGNLVIKKNIFTPLNSKISCDLYGEDNHFSALLKTSNYDISHINNEVYHLGIDKSIDYIKKNEDATLSLLSIYKSKTNIKSDNDLLKTFKIVKLTRLNSIFSLIYSLFKVPITNNLTSSKPSINLLQLYKLTFMCYTHQKEQLTRNN